ncbi:hypothetical protein SpCBS45565_g05139 [Spizellomyces sp. 'palustris']|nr:hypothetical protein SpCBS45565_g05139 [Spizellomyces sp. 'palustris']
MGRSSKGSINENSAGKNSGGKGSATVITASATGAKGKPSRNANSKGKNESATEPPPISQKRQLFGSWTGKTPVSLLYEHCQKTGWEKPQFNTVKKAKGFQCIITIGKEDKKTREVKRITYCPFGNFYPDSGEAKHYAATYALHKVCSHMSLHRLLPPGPRDFWLELDEGRKKLDSSLAQYEYASDPFAAIEARERADTERRAAIAAKAAEQPKAPWESYPVVHMSAENRQMVEDLIRANQAVLAENGDTKSEIKPALHIKKSLVKLGFRPAHVDEALKFCTDHGSALNWLCIHVPEDDLPPQFLPDVSPEINAQRHTSTSLAREYAVKRLASAGFSRKLCEEVLDANEGREMSALVSLSRKLVDVTEERHKSDDGLSYGETEIAVMVDEEVQALDSIFGAHFSHEQSEQGMVYSILFEIGDVPGRNTLEVWLPQLSRYPFETPALVLRNEKLPAYIRLSAMRELGQQAVEMLGSPMVFALEAWLEDNLPRLVATPPPLTTIAVGIISQADSDQQRLAPVGAPLPTSDTKNQNGRAAKVKKTPKGLADDPRLSQRLKNALASKCGAPEYQKMLAYREKLPSFKYKNQIMDALANNQVLIICGETGCGKSTQVGQFILDAMIHAQWGATCNIMCTQPRRISALALAERVASERCEKVGMSVGYSIRGETVRSTDTRLMFCTTGILLRMIQSDPMLSGISHLIVDEVHERGVDSDFLLIIVRDLLPRRPDFRLILMSATVNSDTFSSYFQRAPVFEIPGFTHPVRDFYLEDVLKNVEYTPVMGNLTRGKKGPREEEGKNDREWFQKCEADGLDESAINVLTSVHQGNAGINYDLTAAIVRYICQNFTNDDGAILIFMPGVAEIKKCMDTLRTEVGNNCGRLEIMPLHANLTSKEQSMVFRTMRPGVRKVVIATNIAETSITIDDVVYVIDPGKVKEMQFNGTILTLTETWASRASCKQRRGRAGRVRPGYCYKLFSRHFEQAKMANDSEPEMVRLPLEQLCLQVKSMGNEDVEAFLGKAINPPAVINIEAALKVLRDVSAIDPTDDRLTALGRHMATIPADLRIAKILLFGAIFKCLNAVLTIAACMSSKSPFIAPLAKRDEARAAREQFASDKSDWLTDCRAVHAWLQVVPKGNRAEREFCEQNFLSLPTMSSISDLRRQYLDILIDLNYVPQAYNRAIDDPSHGLNANSTNGRIVKAALVAGLYPNLARIKLPEVQYDQTAHGSVAIAAKAREVKFYTSEDGRVFIHPASVNFTLNRFDDPLIVYHQKISTSKIFLRDTTLCSAWPLLMFGGELQVDHQGRSLSVGRQWRFQAYARIAALINGLRTLLDKSLEAKIADPSLDISATPVVQSLLKLLASDGM